MRDLARLAIFGERSYVMQIAALDAGVLFVLAISGIGVLSTMLAGWSSNNKFSLMGAARGGLADDLVRSGHGASRSSAWWSPTARSI